MPQENTYAKNFASIFIKAMAEEWDSTFAVKMGRELKGFSFSQEEAVMSQLASRLDSIHSTEELLRTLRDIIAQTKPIP